MISQEQYNQLNDGDTVTARYNYSGETFEVTSKIYLSGGRKCLVGWDLHRGAGFWTITEPVIPTTPDWYSAQVISAKVNVRYGRFLFVRSGVSGYWYSPELDSDHAPTALSDVKILVGKDVEL